MKIFLLLIICGLGWVIVTQKHDAIHLGDGKENLQPRLAGAEFAPAPVSLGPRLHFSGTVRQHARGGMIFEGKSWKPYLNDGHDSDEVTGTFFLIGHPGQSALYDDADVEFYAHPSGMVSYTTVLGASRTVRQITYAQLQSRAEPERGPGDWMFKGKGTALDQKPWR